MSTLVDERVVEMRFDNRDFEKNTRQSMSTIQKLKSSLNFSGVANSVNQSVNSIDMNPLIAGLEKTKDTFSAWEIFAITAISNISNRLVNLGINTAKAFTVDKISSGWQQFGEVTRATGTMIAQLTSRGVSEKDAIEQVNDAMEKFSWYSDITSFSTEQMTDAAAKFISKGKDLKETFQIISAIGNLGASAGKSAKDVAPLFELVAKTGDRVMTPLYDTMYRNGIMTEEFTNKLLEAAVAEGTLKKSVDTFDKSVSYVYDNANTHLEITTENIRESISQGWLSSKVFFGALNDYGSSVEKIYKLNQQMQETEDLAGTGKEVSGYDAIKKFKEDTDDAVETAQKALKEAKALGDELAITNAETELSAALADQFSAKWTDAATEARTFEEAVDAVKDAVKTEWSNIFKLIIGDYKEATEVWSEFSSRLYDMFAAPIKRIRKLIQSDNFVGIQKSLFGGISEEDKAAKVPLGAIWNIMGAIQKFIDTVRQAWHEVFPFNTSVSTLAEKFRIFTLNLEATEEVTNGIKGTFKGIFSIFKLGIKILQGVKKAIEPVFKAILGDSGNLIGFLGKIGEKFSTLVDKTDIFVRVGRKVSQVFTTIIDTLKELKIVEKVYNIFKDFFEQFKVSEEAANFLSSLKSTAKTVFDFLLNSLKNVLTFFGNYIIPAIAKSLPYLVGLLGIVVKGITIAVKWTVDSLGKLFDFIKNNETIQNGWTKFIEFMKSIPEKLKSVKPFFDKMGKSIGDFFTTLWEGIKKLGSTIANFFKLNTIGELFAMIGEKIAYGFRKIVEGIRSLSSSDTDNAVSGIKEKLSPLQPLFKGLIDLFKGVWTVLKALLPLIGTILTAVGNLLTQIGNSITKTFNQKIDENGGFNLWYLINGGIGLLIAKGLYDLVYLFNGITSAIANTIDALGGVMRAKAVIMWAEAVKTVALAILMLVGSILIITLIDPQKLKIAVSTLISIMGTMALIITIMGKFLKTSYKQTTLFPQISKKGFKGGAMRSSGENFMGVGSMILSFGLSILALVAALKIIDSIDPDKIGKDLLILGALMAFLAVAIGLMVYISNLGKEAKKGMKGIKGILGFSLGILILTKPMQTIANMDTDKLVKALLSIAALMLAYAVAVKITNDIKAKSMSKMAVAAAGIAAMIAPVDMLGKLDTVKLIQGVGAISILMMMFGAMAALSAEFKMGNALALVGVIFVLANVIKSIAELLAGPLSNISDSAIRNYSIIAGSLFIFMGILLFSFDKIKKKTDVIKPKDTNETLKKVGLFAAVLLALAGVAVLLMHTAKIINTVDWSAFASGIGLFAVVIGATFGIVEYAKRTYISNDTVKNLATISIILVSLTVVMFGIGFLAKSMGSLGENSVKVIGLVLASLAVVLVAVFGLAALVKGTNDKTFKGILAMSALFGAITLMVIGLAAAVKIINSSNIDGIGMLIVVATTVVAAFAMFAIAAIFKKKIEDCAAAMTTLSLAFVMFGVGALAFAAAAYLMQSNVLGIVLVAGAMISLAVAAKILGSASPTLVTIAVAFAAMGIAVLAVGAAMYLIILSLEKMLPMLDELAAKGESLKTVVESVVQGIVEGIANALPTITEKVITSLDILLSWIKQKFGELLDWFMNLDLSKVQKVIDKLVELLFTIVNTVLEALHKNIGTIIKKVIEIILSAIYALIEKLPDIAQALFDLVIGLIDAFGQALADNAERLRESIVNFAKNMWQAFLNFFGIHSPSKETENAGGNIIQGLINGIAKGIGSVVKVVLQLGNKMLKGLLTMPNKFLKAGIELFKGFLKGLKSVAGAIIDFVKWVIGTVKSFFCGGDNKDKFKDAGREAMISYKDGMEHVDSDVNETAKSVIRDVVNELSKTDYFKTIGEEIVRNIALGIESESITISEALSSMLWDAIEETSDSMEELQDAMGGSNLDKFVSSFSETIFGGLATGMNAMNATFFEPINDSINAAVKIFRSARPNLENEAKKLASVIDSVQLVQDAGDNVIVQRIQDISKLASTAMNRCSDIVSTGFDMVTNVVDTGLSAINSLLETAATALSYLLDSIFQIITTAFDGLKGVLTKGYNWLSDAISSLREIIDSALQLDDEETTISVVMDISDVEEKTDKISDMLQNTKTLDIATSTSNAQKASSEINAAKQASEQVPNTNTTQLGTTDDQGGVYNITFNITGNDPKAIADEVSKRFQQYTSRRNSAYGRGNI